MAVVCATLQRLERASRLASRPPRRYTRGKAWRLPMWEIHLGADDRVIHAVFRAEIADVAITGIDADPHLEGLLETAGAPFLLQFDHLPLHGHSHPHAGPRIGPPLSRGRPRESFDDDLPVHPRMRCADVKVVARLIEGDLLRLARVQDSSVPASDFAAFERSRSVRCVAGIAEGQRRARLDLGTTREKDIFHIVGADLDLVDVIP